MKAIAYHYQPGNDSNCFSEIDIDQPQLGAKDLLVRVKAISVNPVDYKVKSSIIREKQTTPRILGWDTAGIVEQVGQMVTLFKPGDQVYYAGNITSQGSNSEYHAVDERIVGYKPTSLTFEQAAALPLTAITAWESLFEQLAIKSQKTAKNQKKSILIIGGAGGVGSIAIQLAKQVAGLRVIATASRPQTINWCKKMGADFCINHHDKFIQQLQEIGITDVDYILCCNDTQQHWQNMADVIKPQGKICSIVETEAPLDMNLIKSKSVIFAWEFMFTKSMYQTQDMQSQYELLNQVAELIDQKVLQTTLNRHLGFLSATNLAQAHAELETTKTIGKIVLSGIND